MATIAWSRPVLFTLLFFVQLASGAQWPSHMRGATSHHAGGRPGLRSEQSGSHSSVAVASTAGGQQVALNRIAHGQRSRFLPAASHEGSRGTLPPPLMRATGVQGTPLVARSAATRHKEQNLFYIIDGKEMHTWKQKEPNLVDQHHEDHNFEVGISGTAQPLTSLVTGLETVPWHRVANQAAAQSSQVPMETVESRNTWGSSMIDASSSQLGEKQVPTTGMLQSTTAAALAATTGAPAPLAAAEASTTAAPVAASPVNHRMSISMLLAILGIVVALAFAVAYWFLARHRRHGPIDEVPNDGSLYKQRRAGTQQEGRRHSRRASALMAEGLISPRDARDTREPMSMNPARDRGSGSRLTVPDPGARSSRAAVTEGTGRPSAERVTDLVLDNADFAAGARPSFGGSADAASGTGAAQRSSLSYPQQKLGHNAVANPTPTVQVMSISTDTSSSTTPPPTPPRSPRSADVTAVSAAAASATRAAPTAAERTAERVRSKNGERAGQTASEAEHSSSGLSNLTSSTEKSSDEKTQAVPDIIIKPAAPEPPAAPVEPSIEAVTAEAAIPIEVNERPAADGAAASAAVAEESSYAAHRKHRRSAAKDVKDLDARSEESVSSSTPSEKSNYAAERRSRRSVLAEDVAGIASVADGRSQSEYAEARGRRSRKSIPNDDAAVASASAAAAANDANSSGHSRSSSQRRPSTSARAGRKSVGRIMAQQNAEAQKDDDDQEDTMF